MAIASIYGTTGRGTFREKETLRFAPRDVRRLDKIPQENILQALGPWYVPEAWESTLVLAYHMLSNPRATDERNSKENGPETTCVRSPAGVASTI
uniref:Uncharacterized protein n=1 Tax=Cannabis sativa TaxID=3483 RepID=A0A803QFM8_CANSA